MTAASSRSSLPVHRVGVICGLAAGAWLGAAEVPTKLVTAGFSPYLISLGMVAGVFAGRWTLPMLLKGSRYVVQDVREKPHLIVWAILGGLLWAIANTLTIFAIRDVGLSLAFPLWNVNSLVGIFWGWLLFGELRGAHRGHWIKVVGGTVAVLAGAGLISWATSQRTGVVTDSARLGVLAALGAGLLWGTMYIPYRKAYLSGMNPLSFVTIFTVGELVTVFVLAIAFDGGWNGIAGEIARARPVLFWLFLGGLCWVIGDLFQQYATRFIGIGRGIPLSNTDQLWGLAWGALAFNEVRGAGPTTVMATIAGSLMMAGGAFAISLTEAGEKERESWRRAIKQESCRYGFNAALAEARVFGATSPEDETSARYWWEYLAAALATGLIVWLAFQASAQTLPINKFWLYSIGAATFASLIAGGVSLWRRTRFS